MALTRITEGVIKPNENYVVNNINSSGVTTSTNFKTGTSNLHNVGIEIAGFNVLGADTPIGTGATIYDAGGALFTGVVTATSFSGSGNISADGNVSGVDATFTGNVSIGGTLTYEDVTNIDSVGLITARGGIHVQDDSTFYGVTSGRNAFWDKSENSLELGDYTYLKFGADEDLTVWSNNTASAINNKTGELRILSGTNVRILKRSDAGLGFAAQVANFNIDGACDFYHNGTKRIETTSSGATLTGNLTLDGAIYLPQEIAHYGDTDTNITFPAADTIAFDTGGTERLRITSTGLMGLGTGSPSDALEISHASDPAIRLHYGGNSGYSVISIDNANNLTLDVDVPSAGSNSFFNVKIDGSEKFRIASNGNVHIGSGNPTIAKLQVSGAGFFGSANTTKTNDGVIIERNSSDGIAHITAGRSGGNYSGFNYYVAGASGVTLRHQIDYQSNFKWFAADGTTERLRIDSSGNVMMGRTSASKKFSVRETSTSSGVYYNAQIGGANHLAIYAV